jgi:hypothetical protein
MEKIRGTRRTNNARAAGQPRRKDKRSLPVARKGKSAKQRTRKMEKKEVNVGNYAKIAKGLRIKIGHGAPSLVKQLEDKIKPKGIRESLESSRQHIDSLYLHGFDTEGLYAELVAWIQTEIVEQLPF